MDIIFTDIFGVGEEFTPQPSSRCLPEWYKSLESYIGGIRQPSQKDQPTATVKRCMPVLDVLSSGYLISTYCDIWVLQQEQIQADGKLKKLPWFQWSNYNPISFHPIIQAPNHPSSNGFPYPKLMNPWAIKTPPGYSTLFLPPVHRENIFTIFPGVVDTDTYFVPVNFPMVLTDASFEGLVPAGTTIAQVIPFQRESWQMSIGTKDDVAAQDKLQPTIRARFFDSYKNHFRQVKVYK